MRNRFTLALTAALVAVVAITGVVMATTPSGVTTTTFAVGQISAIHAKSHTGKWHAKIDTKGVSDVYVLENRIAPGGNFGWHSHPGPSLVIVKSGALTLYRGDDPSCTPEVVEAGQGFVDDGGDIHLVRNEGSVDTVVYVTSIVPTGTARRIDEPSPGNCPF